MMMTMVMIEGKSRRWRQKQRDFPNQPDKVNRDKIEE